MKILHIITGLRNGGAEAVLFRLATEDRQVNQHFVISLMDRGIYGERLEQNGCTVRCLDLPRGKLTLHALLKLYRHIKAIRPDVVQSWMYHADLVGGLVARLAGIKSICWGIRNCPDLKHLKQGENKSFPVNIIKLCAWLSSYIPSRIVCCSAKAVSLHETIGYAREKITVIPNGYALDRYRPDPSTRASIRETLGLEPDELVFGMVARFHPQKDHRNLIQALKILTARGRKFIALLIGDDINPDNAQLMCWIREAGLEANIRLLGPRSDVPSIMNALDVHVLSSYREGFPNVLAEAMSCGTPCVATDAGDAGLIVGTTGWIVEHSNAEALANALETASAECIGNRDKWNTRRALCRQRIVENFTLEKMVLSFRKVWDAAAPDGSGAGRLPAEKIETTPER